MKPLASSLREKKRYLTYEVITSAKLDATAIKKAVEQGIQAFLGIHGCAKAGILLIENNNKKGIVKVHPKYVDQVKTALMLVKEIDKKKVLIKTNRVSGMIHKVKKEAER